jgi:hypothetical protein
VARLLLEIGMANRRHPDSISGIYAIICRVNGKKYYGSSYNCRNRKSQHWWELRRNSHKNAYLQRAWNKYGEASFDFVVVQQVPFEKLLEIENQYLPFGDYNIFNDAERPTNVAPIEKTCHRCGVKFLDMACTEWTGRGKFCSMQCYQADHKGDVEERNCKLCGWTFITYSHRVAQGRGAYCSKSCWSMRTGGTIEIKCGWCDNLFKAKACKARKFCSHSCYSKAKKTDLYLERPCQNCAVMFVPRSHSSVLKFCSRKCFAESRRNLQRRDLNEDLSADADAYRQRPEAKNGTPSTD